MITSATQALTEDPILIENNAHVNNEGYSDEGGTNGRSESTSSR